MAKKPKIPELPAPAAPEKAVGEAEPRNPMVGARVPRPVVASLDALAKRLRSQNPNEPNNRSTAIRTCIEVTDVVLRGDRMEALQRRGVPLPDAVEEVVAAGLASLRGGK